MDLAACPNVQAAIDGNSVERHPADRELPQSH